MGVLSVFAGDVSDRHPLPGINSRNASDCGSIGWGMSSGVVHAVHQSLRCAEFLRNLHTTIFEKTPKIVRQKRARGAKRLSQVLCRRAYAPTFRRPVATNTCHSLLSTDADALPNSAVSYRFTSQADFTQMLSARYDRASIQSQTRVAFYLRQLRLPWTVLCQSLANQGGC